MKIALVTGSNSGIGKATALELASHGYKVYASMRDTSRGSSIVAAAEEKNLDVVPIQLDVTSTESMNNAVSSVLERESQIDVLVNNAGIGYGAPIEFVDDDLLRATMETNFFGATKMMQLVIPNMRTRGTGAIVNISSIAGRYAHPCQGPYCASKFALEAMTDALAAEVAPFGVRVLAIEPGVVDTSIRDKLEQLSQAEPPPPGFPYTHYLERLFGLMATWLEHQTQPEDVARLVYEAVTSDAPKLRYVIGPDAEAQARMLREHSDEVRNALLAADNERFWQLAKEYGLVA